MLTFSLLPFPSFLVHIFSTHSFHYSIIVIRAADCPCLGLLGRFLLLSPKNQSTTPRTMGVASQYAPVPPSYDAVLDQRSDKVRARDFGVDAALLAEEMEDDDEEDEYGDFRRARRRRDEGRSSCCTLIRRALLLAALVTLALALGFCAGTKHERMKVGSSSSSSISGHAQQQLSEGTSSKAGGMLPPQSLVPDSAYFSSPVSLGASPHFGHA